MRKHTSFIGYLGGLIALMIVLAACSGGGGSPTPASTPEPTAEETTVVAMIPTEEPASQASPIPGQRRGDVDTDGDGVFDDIDQCLTDGDYGYGVDEFGCPNDTDKDGFYDHIDQCPDEADLGLGLDAVGCPILDSDNDGYTDDIDSCPFEGDAGFGVDGDGCPIGDNDGDGYTDDIDDCPSEGDLGYGVDGVGCPNPEPIPDPVTDTDGDGYDDNVDQCPADGGIVDALGCPLDSDNDGVVDNDDLCPTEGDLGFGVDANGCPNPDPEITPIVVVVGPDAVAINMGITATCQTTENGVVALFELTNPNESDINHGYTDQNGVAGVANIPAGSTSTVTIIPNNDGYARIKFDNVANFAEITCEMPQPPAPPTPEVTTEAPELPVLGEPRMVVAGETCTQNNSGNPIIVLSLRNDGTAPLAVGTEFLINNDSPYTLDRDIAVGETLNMTVFMFDGFGVFRIPSLNFYYTNLNPCPAGSAPDNTVRIRVLETTCNAGAGQYQLRIINDGPGTIAAGTEIIFTRYLSNGNNPTSTTNFGANMVAGADTRITVFVGDLGITQVSIPAYNFSYTNPEPCTNNTVTGLRLVSATCEPGPNFAPNYPGVRFELRNFGPNPIPAGLAYTLEGYNNEPGTTGVEIPVGGDFVAGVLVTNSGFARLVIPSLNINVQNPTRCFPPATNFSVSDYTCSFDNRGDAVVSYVITNTGPNLVSGVQVMNIVGLETYSLEIRSAIGGDLPVNGTITINTRPDGNGFVNTSIPIFGLNAVNPAPCPPTLPTLSVSAQCVGEYQGEISVVLGGFNQFAMGDTSMFADGVPFPYEIRFDDNSVFASDTPVYADGTFTIPYTSDNTWRTRQVGFIHDTVRNLIGADSSTNSIVLPLCVPEHVEYSVSISQSCDAQTGINTISITTTNTISLQRAMTFVGADGDIRGYYQFIGTGLTPHTQNYSIAEGTLAYDINTNGKDTLSLTYWDPRHVNYNAQRQIGILAARFAGEQFVSVPLEICGDPDTPATPEPTIDISAACTGENIGEISITFSNFNEYQFNGSQPFSGGFSYPYTLYVSDESFIQQNSLLAEDGTFIIDFTWQEAWRGKSLFLIYTTVKGLLSSDTFPQIELPNCLPDAPTALVVPTAPTFNVDSLTCAESGRVSVQITQGDVTAYGQQFDALLRQLVPEGTLPFTFFNVYNTLGGSNGVPIILSHTAPVNMAQIDTSIIWLGGSADGVNLSNGTQTFTVALSGALGVPSNTSFYITVLSAEKAGSYLNSLLQPLVDRYNNGETITLSDLSNINPTGNQAALIEMATYAQQLDSQLVMDCLYANQPNLQISVSQVCDAQTGINTVSFTISGADAILAALQAAERPTSLMMLTYTVGIRQSMLQFRDGTQTAEIDTTGMLVEQLYYTNPASLNEIANVLLLQGGGTNAPGFISTPLTICRGVVDGVTIPQAPSLGVSGVTCPSLPQIEIALSFGDTQAYLTAVDALFAPLSNTGAQMLSASEMFTTIANSIAIPVVVTHTVPLSADMLNAPGLPLSAVGASASPLGTAQTVTVNVIQLPPANTTLYLTLVNPYRLYDILVQSLAPLVGRINNGEIVTADEVNAVLSSFDALLNDHSAYYAALLESVAFDAGDCVGTLPEFSFSISESCNTQTGVNTITFTLGGTSALAQLMPNLPVSINGFVYNLLIQDGTQSIEIDTDGLSALQIQYYNPAYIQLSIINAMTGSLPEGITTLPEQYLTAELSLCATTGQITLPQPPSFSVDSITCEAAGVMSITYTNGDLGAYSAALNAVLQQILPEGMQLPTDFTSAFTALGAMPIVITHTNPVSATGFSTDFAVALSISGSNLNTGTHTVSISLTPVGGMPGMPMGTISEGVPVYLNMMSVGQIGVMLNSMFQPLVDMYNNGETITIDTLSNLFGGNSQETLFGLFYSQQLDQSLVDSCFASLEPNVQIEVTESCDAETGINTISFNISGVNAIATLMGGANVPLMLTVNGQPRNLAFQDGVQTITVDTNGLYVVSLQYLNPDYINKMLEAMLSGGSLPQLGDIPMTVSRVLSVCGDTGGGDVIIPDPPTPTITSLTCPTANQFVVTIDFGAGDAYLSAVETLLGAVFGSLGMGSGIGLTDMLASFDSLAGSMPVIISHTTPLDPSVLMMGGGLPVNLVGFSSGNITTNGTSTTYTISIFMPPPAGVPLYITYFNPYQLVKLLVDALMPLLERIQNGEQLTPTDIQNALSSVMGGDMQNMLTSMIVSQEIPSDLLEDCLVPFEPFTLSISEQCDYSTGVNTISITMGGTGTLATLFGGQQLPFIINEVEYYLNFADTTQTIAFDTTGLQSAQLQYLNPDYINELLQAMLNRQTPNSNLSPLLTRDLTICVGSPTPEVTPTEEITPVVTPDPVSNLPIIPQVNCVDNNGDGTYTAYFGYYNLNTTTIVVPFGVNNLFVPGAPVRNQPTVFQPGRYERVFSVVFDGVSLIWMLSANSAPMNALATSATVSCDGVQPEITPVVTPDPVSNLPIIPQVNCVDNNGDGTYTAYFGYYNLNTTTISVPLGANNLFMPGAPMRNQPTVFQPGRHERVFSVVFDGSTLSWVLTYITSATASASSLSIACDSTPDVTPVVTPDFTPDVTPIVTPTEEITPIVTPTEEMTPDATPTTEITPDVTPTAEITPTQDVTPTPEITPIVTLEIPTLPTLPTLPPLPTLEPTPDAPTPFCGATFEIGGQIVIDLSGSGCGIQEERPVQNWTPIEIGGAVCLPEIIYHTDETGDWELFWASANRAPENLSNGVGYIDLAPTRSPDGRWIAFSSNRDGNWEIYAATVDGSTVIRLTDNDSAVDFDPSWSPDGTKIVYESNVDGNWELRMINLLTGEKTRLTNHPAPDINPAWHPNGTTIAFQSSREDGLWQIYEYNFATGTIIRLSDGTTDDTNPQYRPDGSAILYQSVDNNGEIRLRIMDGQGNPLMDVPTMGSRITNAIWSPDGMYIAYQATPEIGFVTLYVYEIGTGATRQITANGNAFSPAWICDTTNLVFTSNVQGNNNLYVVNALPMDAEPVDLVIVDPAIGGDANQRDPQNSPAEEDASRGGNLPPK